MAPPGAQPPPHFSSQISDSRSDLESDGQIRRDLTVPSRDLAAAPTDPTLSDLKHPRSEIGSLRSKIGSLRSKIGSLRSEIGSLRSEIGSLRSDLTGSSLRLPPRSANPMAGSVTPTPSNYFQKHPEDLSPPFIDDSARPSITNGHPKPPPSDEAQPAWGCVLLTQPWPIKGPAMPPAPEIATQSSVPASISSATIALQESSVVYPGWRIPASSRASSSSILVAELEERLGEEAEAVSLGEAVKIQTIAQPVPKVKFQLTFAYSSSGLIPCDPEIIEYEPGFGPW